MEAANKAKVRQFGDIGNLLSSSSSRRSMCSKEVKTRAGRADQSTTSSVFLGFDRRYQPRALRPARVPASTA